MRQAFLDMPLPLGLGKKTKTIKIGWIVLIVTTLWSVLHNTPMYWDSTILDESSVPTTTSIHQHCHSTCTNFSNILWYNYGDQAGFDDRRQVLFSLANLAASLCARLVVPPPHEWLDSERHRTMTSPALQWKDLVHIAPSTILWPVRRPHQEFLSKEYHPFQRWTIRQPQQFWQEYRKLRMLVSNSSFFLWEIKVSWHIVKKQLHGPTTATSTSSSMSTRNSTNTLSTSPTTISLPPQHDHETDIPSVFLDSTFQPTSGCLYIDPFGVPPVMQVLVDKIWTEILHQHYTTTTATITAAEKKKKMAIGLLHIRRGDSLHRCNTSLAKVALYLQCSLQTLERHPAHYHPPLLLLASDEEDPTYRQSLTHLVSTMGLPPMIDLDALTWKHVREQPRLELATNYYAYALESVLKRAHVDFVLEQRQTLSCPDCTDLSWVYPPTSNSS